MRITKFDHSGIAIEKNERVLLMDPVEFSTKIPDYNNVDAIIITHKHSDHFQPEVINRIIATNPSAKIFICNDMTDEIKHSAEVVLSGISTQVGEFNLSFFGHDHAPIVDNVSLCNNFGVVIDGDIINPGDSFDIPESAKPEFLFVPISAPWLKVEESMKYISKVMPKKVIPAHDALLSPLGHTITNNWIKKSCDEIGAEYVVLEPGKHLDTQ